MRSVLVALLFLPIGGAVPVYGGMMTLFSDQGNDADGAYGPDLDPRGDITSVRIFEGPDFIRLNLNTNAGFATFAYNNIGTQFSSTLKFSFAALNGTTHDYELAADSEFRFSRDGTEIPDAVEETENQTARSYTVLIRKQHLTKEWLPAPADQLTNFRAWVNGTNSVGGSSDVAPNEGPSQAWEFSGGLVIPAFEAVSGPTRSAGPALAVDHQGRAQTILAVTSEQDSKILGIYQLTGGNPNATFVAPFTTSDGDFYDRVALALDFDTDGTLQALYPVTRGQGGLMHASRPPGLGWNFKPVALEGESLTLAGGNKAIPDIAARDGRVVAALQAPNNELLIAEKDGDAWKELRRLANARFPRIELDSAGLVHVAFLKPGAADEPAQLMYAMEDGWGVRRIASDLYDRSVDQEDYRGTGSFGFALRPDDAPAFVWADGSMANMTVLVDGVPKTREAPFAGTPGQTARLRLAYDDYGNAYVAQGANAGVAWIRTVYGHWYGLGAVGPMFDIAASPDGRAMVVSVDGTPRVVTLREHEETAMYPGFATPYSQGGAPLDTLPGQKDKINETAEETAGTKKKSPAPAVVLPVLGLAAILSRRRD